MHSPIESSGSSASGDTMNLLLGYPEILTALPEEQRGEALSEIYRSVAENDSGEVDKLTLALVRNADPEVRRLAIAGVKSGYSSPETAYQAIAILIADADPSIADAAYRYEVDRELGELSDTILNSVEVLDSDRLSQLVQDDAVVAALAEITANRRELVDRLDPDWSNLNGLLDFIIGQEAEAAERLLAADTKEIAISRIQQTLAELRAYMHANHLLPSDREADSPKR